MTALGSWQHFPSQISRELQIRWFSGLYWTGIAAAKPRVGLF